MSVPSSLRGRLRRAALHDDDAERVLLLAAVVSDALRHRGLHPVLVGGAAVEIFTRAAYTTKDLDFVVDSGRSSEAAMQELGFERRGRVWFEPELEIVVEFPSGVLAPAASSKIEVEGSQVEVIAIEDLIVDRLAAWKYWKWHPDGAAAALLLVLHGDGLDCERLHARATEEDVSDALSAIRRLLETTAEPHLNEEVLSRAHQSLAAVQSPGSHGPGSAGA
ncbi:MAG: hypothetical protein ACE5HV_02700 [Acidobacteriota bacterium]